MVDHDSLAAAFSRLGLDVHRADPLRLAGTTLSDDVRRVLTQVGLPEAFGRHVSFDNLQEGGVVMDAVEAGRSRFRIGFGLNDDGILVDGPSGEVFADQNDEERRISPSLDSFVNFLYLMEVMLGEADENDWSSPDEVERTRRTMAERLTEADPDAMSEAGDFWRDMFEYSY